MKLGYKWWEKLKKEDKEEFTRNTKPKLSLDYANKYNEMINDLNASRAENCNKAKRAT